MDPVSACTERLLEPEKLARQKLHVTQKPQNDLTSGPAGKAWPGENVDEPSSPAFTTGATFFSKLSVMDTSANSVSKEIGSLTIQ